MYFSIRGLAQAVIKAYQNIHALFSVVFSLLLFYYYNTKSRSIIVKRLTMSPCVDLTSLLRVPYCKICLNISAGLPNAAF